METSAIKGTCFFLTIYYYIKKNNKIMKITKQELQNIILEETKKVLNLISLGMIGRASGKAFEQGRTNQRSTMLKDASERINKKYQPLVIQYNEKHGEKDGKHLRIYVEPNAEFSEELPSLRFIFQESPRF